MLSLDAQLIVDPHVLSAHVADSCAHTRLPRKHLDAPFLPAGSTERMLMEKVLPAGKLVTVEHDAKLKMTSGFAESSSHIIDLHPVVGPPPQHTEVSAGG